MLANASAPKLLLALGKRLWARTLLRLLIKFYGCVGVGIAASYALAKKKEIKGKTVLITGGAGGLGKALAHEFARRGAKRIILWDIAAEALAATEKELQALQPESEFMSAAVDISKRETIYTAADEILKKVGFVDVVVNNAGILGGKPLMELDDRRIQLVFDVNTMANFWMAKKFLPSMMQRDDGHIVTIASVASYFPIANSTDYNASKAAAKMFTDALRMELKCYGKKGVKTLSVCPAGMNTALFKGMKTLPGLTAKDPSEVAVEVVNAVQSQKELHLTHFPLTHMGVANFGIMPVWFSDLCNSQTNDSITTLDLGQANSVFAKMETTK